MPLPSDRAALIRSVQRQSVIVAAGYGMIGLLGITGLPFYVDTLILAGIVAPLQVAIVEGFLGWKLLQTGEAKWVQRLVYHQLWVSLLIAAFWIIFWRLDLTPYLEVMPPDLIAQLATTLEPLGLTVSQYMHFIWKGGLIILLPLVTIKQVFFILRYQKRARALRRSN